MRGGGFITREVKGQSKKELALYWTFIDRKTTLLLGESDRIVSVENVKGDVYCLLPHIDKPWFELKSKEGGCLLGRTRNAPTGKTDDLHNLGRIMLATTISGEVIEILLALLQPAIEGSGIYTPEKVTLQFQYPLAQSRRDEPQIEWSPKRPSLEMAFSNAIYTAPTRSPKNKLGMVLTLLTAKTRRFLLSHRPLC